MDELPKRVLYAFYQDRILHFDQVVSIAKVSLPFVRNTINKYFVPEGYLEEIQVVGTGKSQNYFRLTDKGRIAVKQIHIKREWMKTRMAELVAGGMSSANAAIQVAVESVGFTDLTA